MFGFPTETETDFKKLYKFVEQAKFDKLGVFKYSREEGTAASKMDGQIHWKTKQRRWEQIMNLQNQISKEKMKEKISKKYVAIIDKETKDYYIGRTYMDVLDSDGVVYLNKSMKLNIGDFANCKIIDISGEYDLIGEII